MEDLLIDRVRKLNRKHRSWIVRVDAPSVQFQPESNKLLIRSKRPPRFRPGDLIVLMSKAKGKFIAVATVADEPIRPLEAKVESRAAAPAQSEPLTYGIPLTDHEQISDPPEAAPLYYSLTFVRNENRPEVHFRRGYRSLPRPDALAIVTGEAFVSRTAFLTLRAALPWRLRIAFELEEREKYGAARRDYVSRLRDLTDFMEERVFSAGELLLRTEVLFRELNLTDREHYFGDGEPDDEGARTGDSDAPMPLSSIEEQARRFKALARSIERETIDGKTSNQFFEQLFSEISKGELAESEREFERRFARFQ